MVSTTSARSSTPNAAPDRAAAARARPRHSSGRWALLHAEQAVERNRAVDATCWMLLKRYGIVFRDLLVRETNLPKWREMQMAYRRLEDRGEIRGGRFVDGFIGEQFAFPVAVNRCVPLAKLCRMEKPLRLRSRSTQSSGNYRPRRTRSSHLGKDRQLPRWRRRPALRTSRNNAPSHRIGIKQNQIGSLMRGSQGSQWTLPGKTAESASPVAFTRPKSNCLLQL